MEMFERFLDGYCNPENELFNYICKLCEKGLEKCEKEKDKISTIGEWEKTASEIRKGFIKSIGGLDFEDSELKVEYKGDIDKGKYIIRKVIFQSLPGFYVTANLYVPRKIDKPVPGILFACGHSKAAKAEPRYQLAAIELALNNMVVLVVDPPGQGETIQMPERHDIDWGVREHSYIGLTCSLAGMNIARYFIHNLIKALDFLCSLDEVDETRIGVSGNSGGGTQTSYISLVDKRIQAAAPGCYLNGRRQYISRGHAHDSEQNIYDCMNFGLDYGDFISCFAPKPFRILSQQYDFFPIEGTMYSLEQARKIYSLYDSSDNVDIVIDKNMHGLSDVLRDGLVEHFSNVFSPEAEIQKENPQTYLEDEKSLWCTKTGCVIGEIPDARPLDEIVYADFLESRKCEAGLEERIEKVFSINRTPVKPLEKRINPVDFNGFKAMKVFWQNGIGISNAGVFIRGADTAATTYMLFENGTLEMEKRQDEILERLELGSVFVLDVSGTGAVKGAKFNNAPYYNMYGTMHKMCNDLMMCGSSLMELWINDIILSTLVNEGKKEIAAYGKMQPAAAIASLVCDGISGLVLPGKGIDYSKIMKCRAGFIPELEVFGFSKYIDYDELIAKLKELGKCR